MVVISSSCLVVFLDSTFLLYNLKERQIIFAKSNPDWNFRDVRAVKYSDDELAVHLRIAKTIVLLNAHTGNHRALIENCEDQFSYKLLSFPLSKQLLVSSYSENLDKTEFLHYPSGTYFKLTNYRVEHEVYDPAGILVDWQNPSTDCNTFSFHLYDINLKFGREHRLTVKDRMWAVQSVQHFGQQLALVMVCRTEKAPAMINICNVEQNMVLREINLERVSLLVWARPEKGLLLMEEYETRSKRKLSLFQLEKDRLQRVNSLELRADELRTDCCSSTKLAVYMPLLGKESGKTFKVCRTVSRNSLSLHLVDKLGLL